MKKLIAVILLITLCLSLIACGEDYPPVESTEEEAKTVITIEADGETYEIRYELYRALFLQYKSVIDGGDESVWSGENKQTYIRRIDEIIFKHISDIYAVFHLCKKVGIDIYSDIVEESIDDYITASIEGGSVDGMLLEGFGGDYDAYLEYLKNMKNMNYSVQELMFRYSVCSELLDNYYADKSANGEVIRFMREDVEAFYNSNECVRALQIFFSDKYFTEERVGEIRDGVSNQSNEEDVATYMIANSNASESLRNGVVIGKYALDPIYYERYTDAAFSTQLYGTTDVIKVVTGMNDGYYILYIADKSPEHFENAYDEIEAVYIQNTIGKEIDAVKVALLVSAEFANGFEAFDRASISMQ